MMQKLSWSQSSVVDLDKVWSILPVLELLPLDCSRRCCYRWSWMFMFGIKLSKNQFVAGSR